MTTQDAVTPSFAISSALRDPDQLGSEVYEELVGEEIYWTIDIPSKSFHTSYIKVLWLYSYMVANSILDFAVGGWVGGGELDWERRQRQN